MYCEDCGTNKTTARRDFDGIQRCYGCREAYNAKWRADRDAKGPDPMAPNTIRGAVYDQIADVRTGLHILDGEPVAQMTIRSGACPGQASEIVLSTNAAIELANRILAAAAPDTGKPQTPNAEIIELETEWIVSVETGAGGWEFGGAFMAKDVAIENAQIFTNAGKRVRIEECPVDA